MMHRFLKVLLTVSLVLAGQAGVPNAAVVCTKDLNGDGQINPLTEKWACDTSAVPALCPQNAVTCTTSAFGASGGASVSFTNTLGRNGFSTVVAAGQRGIAFQGWTCPDGICRETDAGTIVFNQGRVSGGVSAERITRISGAAAGLQFSGCSGNGCIEASLGYIRVDGAVFTGTVAADSGFVGAAADGRTISFTGLTCGSGGCSSFEAGTISFSGTIESCPYGSQYPCVPGPSGSRCSPHACLDEAAGGLIGSGRKICVQDLNGDGQIDFTKEIAECTTETGGDFCPLKVLNCGIGHSEALCATSGISCPPPSTYNSVLGRCETGTLALSYTCPTTGSTFAGQGTCQDACVHAAACQSGTYPVSISANESSSYWFWGGANRIFCNGPSQIYLVANSGSNRSWSVSGTTCSGDVALGSGGAVSQLVGSGNDLHVYGCDRGCDYESCWWANCGHRGSLYFPRAVWSGQTRANCILDDASGLYFHGQCDWASWYELAVSGMPYTSCPLGDYPCNGGVCSQGTDCTPVMGCPAGFFPVGSLCITQPSGGSYNPVLNPATGRCETPADPWQGCPVSYTYSLTANVCQSQPVCFVGNYDPDTGRCVGVTEGCPYGAQYACLPNPATGLRQCSDSPCFTLTSMPTVPTQPEFDSPVHDGAVDENGQCQGTVYIFGGKGRECRTAGLKTNFFNCCDTEEGSLGPIRERCGRDDEKTVQDMIAGRCHPVGDYCKEKWPFIGCVQRANTYCCFNSKLGRIVNEQGRPQLRTSPGWGDPESPNCRGLTPEEFSNLDFGRMDLSEYFNDIQAKTAAVVKETMQEKVTDYSNRTTGK